jgi:hypothetical protein
MEAVAGSADLTEATIAAMRGQYDRVHPLLDRVRAAVDISEYRGFAARIWHAAGLAELAQGNYVTAYAQSGTRSVDLTVFRLDPPGWKRCRDDRDTA